MSRLGLPGMSRGCYVWGGGFCPEGVLSGGGFALDLS